MFHKKIWKIAKLIFLILRYFISEVVRMKNIVEIIENLHIIHFYLNKMHCCSLCQ